MNEYIVTFFGQFNGYLVAFFYGNDEQEARRNAIEHGIANYRIVSVKFNETYRGYGHI